MVGTQLQPRQFKLSCGGAVDVDAAAADNSVIAEIFARQGPLKGGQQKKVAVDAFKLLTIGSDHPNAELVLAFADEEAAAYAKGDGWVARALNARRVRVEVVEISPELRNEIRTAQHRQRMVNADDVADDVVVAQRV
jgi:hypothetical protein